MEGRLNKTIRHPIMKLLIDFDNLGFGRKDEWVDVTDEVLDLSGSKEKSGKSLGSVTSDIATFTVDNTDKTFSNDNSKSPYFGKIKSNLRFRLLTGFKGEDLVPYASGYVDSFTPSWRDKKILIKTTDFFKLFKEESPPEESFQNISWDALVNILCDHVGLPDFIVRHIPKTEFYYSYFKFEEENCFEALKSLMEIAVGEAYFEQEQFYVKTKLALDYQLDKTVDHDITVDDMFDFEENVDGETIINKVTISSQYKTITPLEVVFETPENIAKVENELITYDGSGAVYVNPDNLPIVHDENISMLLTNITQRKNVKIDGHIPNAGKVLIAAESLPDVATGDTLSISYSFQQLALLAGKTRKYTFVMNQEVDSLQGIDIVVWDGNGNGRREYSNEPDTPNTVSRQGMTFNQKTNTVTLTLKNNYSDPITISTLQLRGYPIKVVAPIEVNVSDLPSVGEFGKKELSIQNNYLNNIKLAEKIGQYIVDNNKQGRKRINIDIGGYSEFFLDEISKVTEDSSGTNHSFTNERIDYTFNPDNGWTLRVSLLELDDAPWVYESFKGESWEKTNSGTPDSDFIKDINANLVRNGGAELYTGFSDKEDIGAISQKHIVPDYWTFVRSTGNATSRIRDGGNLVLHGHHSFEITTTDSGTGHYEQIINSVKPSSTYVLSLMAAVDSCSGRASVLQYADSTLLQTDSIDISTDGPYELLISSLANTTAILIKIEKLAGTEGVESLVFDKVKFENNNEKTPYIETEETTAVQIGQRYANSLVLGNNYGIEVYDENNNVRVLMGQYEPRKYGLRIDNGALEIVNGLAADKLAPDVGSLLDISANNAITSLATDISNQGATLTQHGTLIQQNAEAIELKAAQADLDGYTGRLSTAESNISVNAQAITNKVSTTDYNGNTIASLINQTATTIKIDASKVDISGFVTFYDLSTSGRTTVHGANIISGTIQADKFYGNTFVVGNGVTQTKLELFTADNAAHTIKSSQAAGFHLQSTGSLALIAGAGYGVYTRGAPLVCENGLRVQSGHTAQLDSPTTVNALLTTSNLKVNYGADLYGSLYFWGNSYFSPQIQAWNGIYSSGTGNVFDYPIDAGSGSYAYYRYKGNTNTYLRLGSTSAHIYVNGSSKASWSSMPKIRLEPAGDGIMDGREFGANNPAAMQPVLSDYFMNIEVNGERRINLDERFLDFVSSFDVFLSSSNPKVSVKEKGDTYVTLQGEGVISFYVAGIQNGKEDLVGYEFVAFNDEDGQEMRDFSEKRISRY